MSIDYPWSDPPKQAKIIARLRPGDRIDNLVVLEWQDELFTASRQPEKDELGQLPDDPDIFITAGLFDVQINGYWGRGFKDMDLGPEGVEAHEVRQPRRGCEHTIQHQGQRLGSPGFLEDHPRGRQPLGNRGSRQGR